jgi:hypothetical protein
MKSFRLYRRPLPSIPARFANDLSPEEQARLQQAFRTVSARYRHHVRMTSYALLGFIGSIVAFMFLGGVLKLPLSPWLFCARVGLLDGRVRLDAFITESGVPWVWQRYGLQIWTLLS